MGDKSAIEWTDATWNPTRGCTRVSEGCRNCYAERMAARFSGPGQPYHGLARMTKDGPRWTGKVEVVEKNLDLPTRWKRPRRIFVDSMSDLFHPEVSDETIRRIRSVMAKAPRHTFQVLTKRPLRMLEFSEANVWAEDGCGWPGNVWLGVSVESEAVAGRVEILRRTTAHVRFLSVEPLIGPLPRLDLRAIHWVIVGGESGPNARPMDTGWVREIRDQCIERGVPFFFKQWGGQTGKRGHDEAVLDGRRWVEFPKEVA